MNPLVMFRPGAAEPAGDAPTGRASLAVDALAGRA
jgi:hypothetical protein